MVPEVLVYMAFVAIANFAQPSFELGYALKLTRMMFLMNSSMHETAWTPPVCSRQ